MNSVYTLTIDKAINFENTIEMRLFNTLAKAKMALVKEAEKAKIEFDFAFENGKPLKNWEFVENDCIFDLWLWGEANKHRCFIKIGIKEVE